MATSWELRQVTRAAIAEVAERMRASDRRELKASMGADPLQALEQSILVSYECYEGVADGETLCLFGVGAVSALTGVGAPWMLGTDALERHTMTFARVSKLWIRDIRTRYSLLVNYVDARNPGAIRWLEWLGFELSEPVPFGVEKRPFHRIEMKGELPCATPSPSV